MTGRAFIAAIGILALLVGLYCFLPTDSTDARGKGEESSAVGLAVPGSAAEPGGDRPAQPDDPRLERLADGHVVLRDAVSQAAGLHQAAGSPAEDLAILDAVLGLYRFVYRANPVGSENAELMEQLMGKNPKQLIFFPREHPSLADSGALLDRWGTPYFFHPLSAQSMDLRTAGPDGKFWSDDDVSLGLEAQAAELQLRPAR